MGIMPKALAKFLVGQQAASKFPLQLQLHVLLASAFTSQAVVDFGNCNCVEDIHTW